MSGPGAATSTGANVSATVVIACHSAERWGTLTRAIRSALDQRPAPEQVVVAVDHNPELERRLRRELPEVAVVANRHGRGASGTRNSGAETATSTYLVFLDDDTVAHPGWLGQLVAPLRAEGAVVGTGGGVDPAWATRRPDWFPDEFGWVIGASYAGMPEREAPVRGVWSENMAIRRDAFEAIGGFRTDFGKVGNVSRPEDTDLCIRARASRPGSTWRYVPDARVDHLVPADRATFAFFLRRTFWEGRGKVEMSAHLGEDRDLGAESAYLRRTIPAGIVRNLRSGSGRGARRAGAMVAGVGAAGAGAAVSLLARYAFAPRTRR